MILQGNLNYPLPICAISSIIDPTILFWPAPTYDLFRTSGGHYIPAKPCVGTKTNAMIMYYYYYQACYKGEGFNPLMYPNIMKLIYFIDTIAECERSFSTINRAKHPGRSTISDIWTSDLVLLAHELRRT